MQSSWQLCMKLGYAPECCPSSNMRLEHEQNLSLKHAQILLVGCTQQSWLPGSLVSKHMRTHCTCIMHHAYQRQWRRFGRPQCLSGLTHHHPPRALAICVCNSSALCEAEDPDLAERAAWYELVGFRAPTSFIATTM